MKAIEAHDIARSIILALERMAFVLTDEIDQDEIERFHRPTCHARVHLVGPNERVVIQLSATTGFLTEFAASMLGLEEHEVDLARLGDHALKELCNVIGGEVLLVLGGSEAGLRLSIPQVIDDADFESSQPSGSAVVTCHLDADDQLLSFQLFDISPHD